MYLEHRIQRLEVKLKSSEPLQMYLGPDGEPLQCDHSQPFPPMPEGKHLIIIEFSREHVHPPDAPKHRYTVIGADPCRCQPPARKQVPIHSN